MEIALDYKESHVRVSSDMDVPDAGRELERLYIELEDYLTLNPHFGISYEPVSAESAPEIAVIMSEASLRADVGPMAAVAGTVAELLGNYLLKKGATEVVVDNGGDIFLKLKKEKVVGIHAAQSDFSDRIALKVRPDETPVGICTSSASVGHSVSLGESDAVVVVSKSTPLADAAATSIANEVRGKRPVESGLRRAKSIDGLKGVLIIKGDELGTSGRLPELVRASGRIIQDD